MSAREQILGKLRRSLGVSGHDIERRAAVADRLARAPQGVIPARGQLPLAGRIALFCEMAQLVSASVEQIASLDDVAGAVARHLRDANLPARLRIGTDERFSGVDLISAGLEVTVGPSAGDDLVGMSFALSGIAETGTLALLSGEANPTTLNFLPDRHIILVQASDIDGDMESALVRIRGIYGKGAMPRTVNFITGPSRSADIEQTLILGAHGPRQLHIMIVG